MRYPAPADEVEHPTVDRDEPPAEVKTGSATPAWVRWGRELCLVAVFCLVYAVLRTKMVQSGTMATQHALSIVHVETVLGIFHEQAVQAFFLHWPNVVRVFNLYYGGTHFIVPAAALIWLAVRHPDRYRRARNVLAVATAVAFACFWLFPVAPPRLLPARFGIIDTLVTLGGSAHVESTLIDTAGDVYAAMPSLHVGWAIWCTFALFPVVRHRLTRIGLVLYPVATTVVVVTTGNHFFTDAASGAALVALVWLVVAPLTTALERPWPLEERSTSGEPNPRSEQVPVPVGGPQRHASDAHSGNQGRDGPRAIWSTPRGHSGPHGHNGPHGPHGPSGSPA